VLNEALDVIYNSQKPILIIDLPESHPVSLKLFANLESLSKLEMELFYKKDDFSKNTY
jgi:hypothetical protein